MSVVQPPQKFVVPAGFLFGAASGAIKKPGRLDVGVIKTAGGAVPSAAVFTKNTFAAAPVLVSRRVLAAGKGLTAGVVVNSGCANAATGDGGMADAETMAGALSGQLPALVSSTGTIGVRLPMDRLMPAVAAAEASAGTTAEDFLRFADSILTTDTRRKVAAETVQLSAGPVHLLGCAKGSGMIAPNMATLLAYVVTDAALTPEALQRHLSWANERSLNCMTVDADTSTNDSLMLWASGAAGSPIVTGSVDEKLWADGLLRVLQSLAKQLARDGEGATKLIEIEVAGAPSFEEARKAALFVANSPLVKTAIHGRDANWGRIAMALGNSGVPFDPAKVDIALGDMVLFQQGAPLPLDEDRALAILSEEFVRLSANLGHAAGQSATVWTCDLSKEYIEINGAYRT